MPRHVPAHAGAYRGYGVTLVRDVPSHGVYFGVYEYLREALEPGSRRKGSNSPYTLFLAGTNAYGLRMSLRMWVL